MSDQINCSRQVLELFYTQLHHGDRGIVDRQEVVAHATLSALAHHWPTRLVSGDCELLEATLVIREREPSRWMTQRRIAIAKLAMEIAHSKEESRSAYHIQAAFR